MVEELGLDLRGVSKFTVIQSNELEGTELVEDERDFTVLQDALNAVKKSEAPFRCLRFHHDGQVYSLYGIPDSEEFRVVTEPILN